MQPDMVDKIDACNEANEFLAVTDQCYPVMLKDRQERIKWRGNLECLQGCRHRCFDRFVEVGHALNFGTFHSGENVALSTMPTR